jgi:hypothetical protein
MKEYRTLKLFYYEAGRDTFPMKIDFVQLIISRELA